MSRNFRPGDFLVFQLEAGFALLRLLAVDTTGDGEQTWHLAAYDELFPDVDTAEAASKYPSGLTIGHPHLALTNRAFESTQVARIANVELTSNETTALSQWRGSKEPEVSDRSMRLLLGLR